MARTAYGNSDESGPEVSGTGSEQSGNGVSLGGAIREAEERGDIGSVGNTTNDAAGTEKRKRGRPAGSKNKGTTPGGSPKAQAGNALSVNSVQFSLTGIHALLAAALSAPELALSETEGEILAKCTVAVARHYNLQASEKAMDIGNAVVAFGSIYGGKIIALSARKGKELRARRAAMPASVVKSALQPSVAPDSLVTVHHPNAAGKPNGAAPLTRKAEPHDQVMLNEVEAPMYSS